MLIKTLFLLFFTIHFSIYCADHEEDIGAGVFPPGYVASRQSYLPPAGLDESFHPKDLPQRHITLPKQEMISHTTYTYQAAPLAQDSPKIIYLKACSDFQTAVLRCIHAKLYKQDKRSSTDLLLQSVNRLKEASKYACEIDMQQKAHELKVKLSTKITKDETLEQLYLHYIKQYKRIPKRKAMELFDSAPKQSCCCSLM